MMRQICNKLSHPSKLETVSDSFHTTQQLGMKIETAICSYILQYGVVFNTVYCALQKECLKKGH